MWPWDHLAVGYVATSLWHRSGGREPPTAATVALVGLGSQLPDLIDKPLGWILGVLPSGVSLAHSSLFALPLCVAVLAWARRRDRAEDGVGFALAYLLHLPADAFFPLVLGADAKVWLFFWPLLPGEHSAPDDVAAHVVDLVVGFVHTAGTQSGLWIVALEVSLLGLALGLWTADGRPGLPP